MSGGKFSKLALVLAGITLGVFVVLTWIDAHQQAGLLLMSFFLLIAWAIRRHELLKG